MELTRIHPAVVLGITRRLERKGGPHWKTPKLEKRRAGVPPVSFVDSVGSLIIVKLRTKNTEVVLVSSVSNGRGRIMDSHAIIN